MTSSVINNILLNQNISVSDFKLKELLKVQSIIFDLPITSPEKKNLLLKFAGKRGGTPPPISGVYVFIHKITGQKYVGSSNLLRRRIDYYFKGDFPLTGQFLPLLKKEGLGGFKLQIFKLDSNKFHPNDALILEQYFLLHKEFNLNSSRVVNIGSYKGQGIYLYDLTCTILHYHATSKIKLKRVLHIHTQTTTKYLDSKIPYLNQFFFFSFIIPTASLTTLSIPQLLILLQKGRDNLYSLGLRRNIPVILEIKKGNKWVVSPDQKKFDSLTACIDYLRGLGLIIKRDTLSKYIKNGKEFHNFLCKYYDKNLPDEKIGLIINEYKNTKNDLLKINKKNKPILVKGIGGFEKQFESIKETITYFDSINIKLDRKNLYLHLKEGKSYKGYYFSYKSKTPQ